MIECAVISVWPDQVAVIMILLSREFVLDLRYLLVLTVIQSISSILQKLEQSLIVKCK